MKYGELQKTNTIDKIDKNYSSKAEYKDKSHKERGDWIEKISIERFLGIKTILTWNSKEISRAKW